jgi:ABC-type antimicrobial peptide transport system permease subunit
MDKMVISGDMLREMGYQGKPEEIIGKKMLFIFDGVSYPDWGEDPPKPTQNMNENWWEEQKKNSHEIKVEIIGVMESGPTSGGQNFVTLDFAERLMTQKNWKYDESSKQESKDGGNYQEPTLKLEKTNNLEKNGYGSIMIKADDTQFVQGIAEEIKAQGYGVSTAQEMIDEMIKAFNGIGIVLGAIGGVALFVAAIGIINTMVMATYERTREIGVLRACGATRATIRKLFILEAGMIGFWGGVFGLGFSYAIAQVGNLISNKYFSQYSIPIQNIASFPLWLIIGVLIFTTLLGIFAGLYPAIKASRLDPVEALRYE